jgi:hypothetical protein
MADPWKLTRLSSSKGIEISQKRAKAIQEARAPTTNKELNRLLGPFPSSGSRNSDNFCFKQENNGIGIEFHGELNFR